MAGLKLMSLLYGNYNSGKTIFDKRKLRKTIFDKRKLRKTMFFQGKLLFVKDWEDISLSKGFFRIVFFFAVWNLTDLACFGCLFRFAVLTLINSGPMNSMNSRKLYEQISRWIIQQTDFGYILFWAWSCRKNNVYTCT